MRSGYCWAINSNICCCFSILFILKCIFAMAEASHFGLNALCIPQALQITVLFVLKCCIVLGWATVKHLNRNKHVCEGERTRITKVQGRYKGKVQCYWFSFSWQPAIILLERVWVPSAWKCVPDGHFFIIQLSCVLSLPSNQAILTLKNVWPQVIISIGL